MPFSACCQIVSDSNGTNPPQVISLAAPWRDYSPGLTAYRAQKAVRFVTQALQEPQRDGPLLLLSSQAIMATSKL